MNYGTLIIYSSPNGESDWTSVKPGDVPDFVKDPDVLARLVDGDACADTSEGEATVWYAAQRVLTEDEQSTLRNILEERRRIKYPAGMH